RLSERIGSCPTGHERFHDRPGSGHRSSNPDPDLFPDERHPEPHVCLRLLSNAGATEAGVRPPGDSFHLRSAQPTTIDRVGPAVSAGNENVPANDAVLPCFRSWRVGPRVIRRPFRTNRGIYVSATLYITRGQEISRR